MARYIVTGGLGTGKTTLVEQLARDVAIVAEPARELIAEHRASTGEHSLDDHPQLFVDRMIDRSIAKYTSVDESQLVIFDRGLPDCVAYAQVFDVDTAAPLSASHQHRYETTVFVTPPWEDIYATDDMRSATFAQATAFFAEVVAAYDRLGYELVEVPKAPPADRAHFVRERLGFQSAAFLANTSHLLPPT